MAEDQICTRCGAKIPASAIQSLCPACLLRVGMESQSHGESAAQAVSAGVASSSVPSMAATLDHEPGASSERGTTDVQVTYLTPGEHFGEYVIARRLGAGGMGAVYAADQLETGRHVALKVLKHSLSSSEARKRFLREGRLAASINHPNSVYVYGTEEIAGTPVISMELVPGGTLQDRVKGQGPLPVGEAVDAILEIIAGLEAAQKIGILHRDVKPANCFIDSDGTVKVGDFGLSISTGPRGDFDISHQGTFLGTPAFASPEQLRGEELNVRSDIYSVGMTLYYLLTGRTPFVADNLVQLLATVLEKPVETPRKFRPDIPQGLAQVVLRCLAKQSTDRYASYDDLRKTLLPYSSTAPTPAPLGLRFAAGLVDRLVVSQIMMLAQLLWFRDLGAMTRASTEASGDAIGLVVLSQLVWTLYYALPEGRWGASLGKLLFRLRLVDASRGAPGFLKAAVRAITLTLVPLAPWSLRWIVGQQWYDSHVILMGWLAILLPLLLFSTMRRRNGFAAVHDLLTGTRVIQRSAYQARPALTVSSEPSPTKQAATIGPFHVQDVLEEDGDRAWILGYDTRLLRSVWIRKGPAGEPPVPDALRGITRSGRLRWLQGARTATESWDAYEAPSGSPLLNLLDRPQPWNAVRFWLLDLAEELAAVQGDELPALLLDRVWITADGRAKLLDFPAPQIDPLKRRPRAASSGLKPAEFLNLVAISALEGREAANSEAASHTPNAPLPIAAHHLLVELPRLTGLDTAGERLRLLTGQSPAIGRERRIALVVACCLPSLAFAAFMAIGLQIYGQWTAQHPELQELTLMVILHRDARQDKGWEDFQSPEGLKDLEVYIAHRFRKTIEDPEVMNSPMSQGSFQPDGIRELKRIVAEHPNPTPAEIAAATERMDKVLKSNDLGGKGGALATMRQLVPFMALVMALSWLGIVGVLSLAAAATFRGGLLWWIFGIDAVTQNGVRASRLRLAARSGLAWLPVLLLPITLALLMPLAGVAISAAILATIQVVLTAWSLWLPERGLPDRMAGTWLVPA